MHLQQRPNLRHQAVKEFLNYKDALSAEYWNKFVMSPRIQHFQAALYSCKCNVPPQSIYSLTDSINGAPTLPEQLATPAGVDVYVVDKLATLRFVEQEIERCKSSDYAVVGLDAEWSPYVGTSR